VKKLGLNRAEAGQLLIGIAWLVEGGGYDSKITPKMVARAAFCFVMFSDDDMRYAQFLDAQSHVGDHQARQSAADVIFAVVEHGTCRAYPHGVSAFDFSLALREAMKAWGVDHTDAFYAAFRKVHAEYYVTLGVPLQSESRTGPDG
jgi:hypothetical protein